MSNNSCRIPRYATYPDCSGAKEKQQTSELELRIRKEVMDAMEELKSFEDEFEDETEIYFNNLLNKVIDRLKLLWGE